MKVPEQIVIVNVGANTTHYKDYGKLRSPIFADSRFEFIPIPAGAIASKYETAIDQIDSWPCYKDLRSFYNVNERLTRYLPSEKWLNVEVHNDPEFNTFTYGDCLSTSRASKLVTARKGQVLLFLTHLWNWNHDSFQEPKGQFYFVGLLEVKELLDLASPDTKDLNRYKNNPHILMWNMLHSNQKAVKSLDLRNHKIFIGSENSERFYRAVLFDKNLANAVLRDANGHKLDWSKGTELSRIGSYTRCVKFVKGSEDDESEASERIKILWKHIQRHKT